jgi:hypothetical protein
VIINVGGPTEDKPMVTLETPHDPDRMPSFLNIRVAEIEDLRRLELEGGRLRDAAPAARHRDSLLCWRR